MKTMLCNYKVVVHGMDGTVWTTYFQSPRHKVDDKTRDCLNKYEHEFPDREIKMFVVSRAVG